MEGNAGIYFERKDGTKEITPISTGARKNAKLMYKDCFVIFCN